MKTRKTKKRNIIRRAVAFLLCMTMVLGLGMQDVIEQVYAEEAYPSDRGRQRPRKFRLTQELESTEASGSGRRNCSRQRQRSPGLRLRRRQSRAAPAEDSEAGRTDRSDRRQREIRRRMFTTPPDRDKQAPRQHRSRIRPLRLRTAQRGTETDDVRQI